MKVRVSLPDFVERIQDVMPFTANLDTRRILELAIDDINGLLNISYDVARGMPVDMEKICNLLTYMVQEADEVISEAGLSDLKVAVAEMLMAIYDEMRGYHRWANMRFKYIRHRESIHGGPWSIVLSGQKVFDNDQEVCKQQLRIAKAVLEKFCDKNIR